MKRFPELKPNLRDLIVAAAVVVLAAGFALYTWGGRGEDQGALTVVVSVDGEETARFLPEELGEKTYSNNGYTLTVVQGENGGVCVSHSDCPNRDCVHTGTITRAGQSIVCLPARIVIELSGTAPDGVDAVIG